MRLPSLVERHPQRLIALFVLLVVWGLITHGTFAGSGDDPHYLVIAQSLAFDGDFDVANNYADPANLIGAGTLQAEAHARPGRHGVLRPVHDVGMPLLFAPYVRLVYPAAQATAAAPESLLRRARLNPPLVLRHFISLAMGLLTGLLAAQLYALFTRSPGRRRTAAGWALLVALSPPLLTHSYLFFTEIPSALVALWLFRTLSDTRRPDRWALVGAATALLLLIHVRNVALVAGFSLWAVMRLRRDSGRPTARAWAEWGTGAAALLAMRAVIQYEFWGTLVTSPHARGDWTLPLPSAAGETARRMAALFMDPEFGLWPNAPFYLLLIPALLYARALAVHWLRPLPAALLASAYIATLAVPYINTHGVEGGWAPAARMLVPVVPLLAVACISCVQAAGRVVRWTAALLVVLQIVTACIVWQAPKLSWRDGDGANALFQALGARF
jgi:hypothetical protein